MHNGVGRVVWWTIMKCKFCTQNDFDDIKVLRTHCEIDHPQEMVKVYNYLLDHDYKQYLMEIELIESTRVYRHARQSVDFESTRKEDKI